MMMMMIVHYNWGCPIFRQTHMLKYILDGNYQLANQPVRSFCTPQDRGNAAGQGLSLARRSVDVVTQDGPGSQKSLKSIIYIYIYMCYIIYL